MTKTKIEWADNVWNPVTGCTKVSEGCRNCYAETMANRFWGDRKFSDVRIHPERLGQPLDWGKPVRVFVNSMSDLFHKDVDSRYIGNVFQIMQKAKQHKFLILTKRADRMQKLLSQWSDGHDPKSWPDWPLPNVWLGVSVENQKTADERIPLLLQTQAAVRFVSCEPLLGPIDLWKFATREETFGSMYDHRGSYGFIPGFPKDPIKYHEGIDWVIAGGESGKNARPMHPDWARSIRDQCVDAGVPFFFKQWGEWAEVYEAGDGWYCLSNKKGNEIMTRIPNKTKILENAWDGHLIARVGKKRAGRLLDGREWNEFPMSEKAVK